MVRYGFFLPPSSPFKTRCICQMRNLPNTEKLRFAAKKVFTHKAAK